MKHGPNRRHLGKPIPEPVTAVTCTSAIPNLKASEWWTGQPLASSKRGCVPAYLAKERSEGAIRLLLQSGSPRAFCPRDDKVGKGMEVSTMLSLREGSGARDAAIHRVLNYMYDLSLRLLDHSGSPRASLSR